MFHTLNKLYSLSFISQVKIVGVRSGEYLKINNSIKLFSKGHNTFASCTLPGCAVYMSITLRFESATIYSCME